MFQEQLRHIIDVHTPSLPALLKLPPFLDKLCAVNVQISATTTQGADAISDYFEQTVASQPGTQPARAELVEIYCFASRAKMPASFLAGPALCLTAAELLSSGKEGPWHQNRLAFAALAATLIQTDALLILRVVQKSGEASYWALIPPMCEVTIGSNMTLLKLVDQESMLVAGDTQFVASDAGAVGDDIKDASLIDSNYSTNSDHQGNLIQRNFHIDGLDSKDEIAFSSTVVYLSGALLSNFGSPVPFNPLCCCTEGLDLALNRYCRKLPAPSAAAPATGTCAAPTSTTAPSSGNGKRLRSPRSDAQGQHVEESYYVSVRGSGQSRSASGAKAGKPAAASSPSSMRNSSSSAAAKAKVERTPQPESSGELSVTSNSSTDSSGDFQEVVATRSRAVRATLGSSNVPRTAAATTAGHNPGSASSRFSAGNAGRLRRGNGTLVTSVCTDAFTDPIEQWDEEGDNLVRGRGRGRVRGRGEEEEEEEEEAQFIA